LGEAKRGPPRRVGAKLYRCKVESPHRQEHSLPMRRSTNRRAAQAQTKGAAPSGQLRFFIGKLP